MVSAVMCIHIKKFFFFFAKCLHDKTYFNILSFDILIYETYLNGFSSSKLSPVLFSLTWLYLHVTYQDLSLQMLPSSVVYH